VADTCATCRYYLVEATGVVCRRYPPTPAIIPASMLQAATILPLWPNPGAGAWCGEFRPAETVGGVLQFPKRDGEGGAA
jgi:hypothetical protein